jgi:hypothetical protein
VPLGIWGCNGNPEFYAEVDGASQVLFERYGMALLRQQNRGLQWRSGKLNLIGVDYQSGSAPSSERSAMLQNIESLVRKDIPNILLSHDPNPECISARGRFGNRVEPRRPYSWRSDSH